MYAAYQKRLCDDTRAPRQWAAPRSHPRCATGFFTRCVRAGHAKTGGAGGIRTLDRALQPYNGLANRRLQPLGHSSVRADMPDAGASRKRQISGRRLRGCLTSAGAGPEPRLLNLSLKTAAERRRHGFAARRSQMRRSVANAMVWISHPHRSVWLLRAGARFRIRARDRLRGTVEKFRSMEFDLCVREAWAPAAMAS
jgi:hypothetical protein